MTLIKSISGIRGTIGGNPGQNLTPIDIVESISAYGSWLKTNHLNKKIKVWRIFITLTDRINHMEV